MKFITIILLVLSYSSLVFANIDETQGTDLKSDFTTLENYRMNSEQMFSAGLPSASHLKKFRALGVTNVIDLIPEDRSKEQTFVESLGMAYNNIPVDWNNPKVSDFAEYAKLMNEALAKKGTVLTHCKLNWRGSAFTYLYQVNELGMNEQQAKQTMLEIWQPNEAWQAFIEAVNESYGK